MIINDEKTFRDYLDMMIDLHPELFPQDIPAGYHLHGLSPISKKMPGVRTRRIKLKSKDESGRKQVFTVAPSFVMPYRTGYTNAIEKALYLHGKGVSFADLTYVFGRNDQYWYRLVVSLGRNDLVGTTIKFADNFLVMNSACYIYKHEYRNYIIVFHMISNCNIGNIISLLQVSSIKIHMNFITTSGI